MNEQAKKQFKTYAWLFLVYLIAVILFGAWVRITHSGAGCGDHWPTCHGEIIPFEPSTETMIEYTHRITSGFCGILGLILIGWAYRLYGVGRIFWASIVTMVFILFEAAIGAGLVLAELVADNDSVARAVVISLHLVNTLMLTGSAALAAYWADQAKPPPRSTWPDDELSRANKARIGIVVGIVLLIATSMSGAVTALGDTLFPVDPTLGQGLFARIRDDLSGVNHFLVRLRILHPIIAVVASAYLIYLGAVVRAGAHRDKVSTLAGGLILLVVAQVAAGLLNVGLYAPGWLQLTHLLLAQAVWIALILLGYEMVYKPDRKLVS